MTHDRAHTLLLDLAYDELAPDEASEVSRHAAECSDCAAELERIGSARALAARLGEGPVQIGGRGALVEAARRAVASRPTRRWFTRPATLSFGAAAAVIAIVAGVTLKLTSDDLRPAGEETGAPSSASPAPAWQRDVAAPPPAATARREAPSHEAPISPAPTRRSAARPEAPQRKATAPAIAAPPATPSAPDAAGREPAPAAASAPRASPQSRTMAAPSSAAREIAPQRPAAPAPAAKTEQAPSAQATETPAADRADVGEESRARHDVAREPSRPADTRAAEDAARAWLALVDGGRYAESWGAAAAAFREAVPRERWAEQVGVARRPLGHVLERALRSAVPRTSLPGAPDGEYVVLQFDTVFERAQAAVETVTPMRDRDGRWRVSGYFIR
jgi:hypothetical protein